MKPYGVPRIKEAEMPDKVDLKKFGFSSTDRCSKADRGKNSSRRIWKKLTRREGKASIKEI
jgi:hypothetical protein